eukprot:TRINITY_DN23732_c1_g1_i1.p1 TRINITY_DN23732_c1_g1~~TRINITY_DN23732_c1_g1_i1.p1  ORF type:complete len:590 (+),score=125.85 TRINITY_DN23732_c1_g1_i1:67-1836(+)
MTYPHHGRRQTRRRATVSLGRACCWLPLAAALCGLLPCLRGRVTRSLWTHAPDSSAVFTYGGFGPRRLADERAGQTHGALVRRLRGPEARRTARAAVASGIDRTQLYDMAICGAGPAGLSLAACAAERGLKVAVVDPKLEEKWPNNYGCWLDEAEPFGYKDCLDIVWNETLVVFNESLNLTLQRPYGRVDRVALKSKLLKRCVAAGACLDAVAVTGCEHKHAAPSRVDLNDGTGLDALLVVDATGFARRLVKFENDEFDPGYQVTYGALVDVESHPYPLHQILLMDWSEQHLDEEAKKRNERFPSFIYGMPISRTRIFLEETILVSRPLGSSKDLEDRWHQRLQALGIKVTRILEDERAAIPMGGADPIVPQRTLGAGACASNIHPASGYMVMRALEVAPRVADAIAPKIKALRSRLEASAGGAQHLHAAKAALREGELEDLSADAWEAMWTPDDRRQRDFMSFGCELLCQLTPQELRDFFTGFFRLPDRLWENFLSWRLSGVGNVFMGLFVWAVCIPKRFVPTMLWKSLPYVIPTLLLPFASRRGWPRTDSLYTEARWEPRPYEVYEKELLETLEAQEKSQAKTLVEH